jgi:hypothetical protein
MVLVIHAESLSSPRLWYIVLSRTGKIEKIDYINTCDLHCATYQLGRNEMFSLLEPTVMEIPLAKAPLGKDTSWIGATTGSGWHWLSTKFEKCKTPRNSGNRPTRGPIAILDVEGYGVRVNGREDYVGKRQELLMYTGKQQGGKAISNDSPLMIDAAYLSNLILVQQAFYRATAAALLQSP